MNRSRARRQRKKRKQTLVCVTLCAALLVMIGWGIAFLWQNRVPENAGNGSDIPPAGAAIMENDEEKDSENGGNETDRIPESGIMTQEPTATQPAKQEQIAPDFTETSAPVPTEAPAPAPAPPRQMLPLEGLIIGIDPGHQAKGDSSQEAVAPGSTETKMKVSGGTQGVSTRIPEYVVNLEVAFLLRDRLEELGAQVVMTRESHDVNISNQERAAVCNDAGADLVLRLHCNGANDQSVDGISLFVRATGQGAEEALAAAEALMPAMLAATGADNFGIYRRDSYTGLNWSVPPSILVEMGFMSNPQEDEKLCDPVYQAQLVEGMVQGIADYFGREIPEVSE